MAYQIDRFDNSQLTIVEDGTLDQTTNLKFIGKNYAGYGEIQNENLLFLLENFAGGNAPTRAIRGQIWFDTTLNKIKYFVASDNAIPGVGYWKATGGSEVNAVTPNGLSEGDFWWNNSTQQLYVLNAGGDFVLVGPQVAGTGVTNMISAEVQDTTGASKSIIQAVVGDTIIYIISSTEFTLNAVNPIEGFDRIRKGLTMKWTMNADAGVTNSAEVADRVFQYHGTASNAAKLGGIAASEYLTVSAPNFANNVTFSDTGLTIGNGLDLRMYVESDDKAVIENQTGNNSEIRFKATDPSGASQHSVTMKHNMMIPATDNSIALGTTGSAFSEVHSTNFRGIADRATELYVEDGATTYQSGSVAPTPNKLVARDGSGNIEANIITGTATQARYADLAEKYTTCCELAPGTAVAVSSKPDTELEPAKASNVCIGVVSTDPALMMNCEAEGQYIGLKGRLPVRVNGPVKKGQAVYAWNDGVCRTIETTALVGIALETNEDEGEKLVECVLKV